MYVANVKYEGHKFDSTKISKHLNYDNDKGLSKMIKLKLDIHSYRSVENLTIEYILLHYVYFHILRVLLVVIMHKSYMRIHS